MDIDAWHADRAERVELCLKQLLADTNTPPRLREAMEYSTLEAGKRVRALLVFAAGEAFEASLTSLTYVAAALECVHAYSLIHDDLPSMDDDALRRGKPTNHLAFDEATAILAGDALLTLAFEIIASQEIEISAEQKMQICTELAKSAGRNGMVGGQMLDIAATGKALALPALEAMHRAKTGALIRAACICGALCGQSIAKDQLDVIEQYANQIGLAFQVMDDVLDATADTQTLGKTAGADASLNKSTYTSLMGIEKSREMAANLLQESLESLQSIGNNTAPLIYLANRIVNRSH